MHAPRSRRSPPRYERDFEEIRIAEPDYYGDDEFRGYKEREIITDRRRRGHEDIEERESLEIQEEAPFPRKGKTKMPSRLVSKRAIVDLGYPFEEEVSYWESASKKHVEIFVGRNDNPSQGLKQGADR